MARRIEIVFTEEFKTNYGTIPNRIKEKIRKQIAFLQSNPHHPSLRTHKLNDDWEFYVDVHYRCIFQWEGNVVTLLAIGTHKIVDRYKR